MKENVTRDNFRISVLSILFLALIIPSLALAENQFEKSDRHGRKNLCQAMDIRASVSFKAPKEMIEGSKEAIAKLKENLETPETTWISHELPYWVEIDLGEEIDIDKLMISSGIQREGLEDKTPRYKILIAESSLNRGKVWQEVRIVSENNNTQDNSRIISFQPVRARFVRISFEEPAGYVFHVNALAVYEALVAKSDEETLKPETAVFQGGSPYPYEPDFGEVALGPVDDGSTGPFPFGFDLTLYGNTYTQFWINNNGNITLTGPLYDYTPFAFPNSEGHVIIAPFFADVDTRAPGTGLVYINNNTPGQIVITWDRVGYYRMHADKLNSFQLVIQDDSTFGFNDGDHVGFYWGDIEWTTGDLSYGVHAAAGLDGGDGDSTHAEQVPGSFTLDVLNWANTYEWFALTEGLPGDVTPPEIAFTGGIPHGEHKDTTVVTFTWKATDNVTEPDSIEFRYRLDESPFTEWGYDTSVTFNNLLEGLHTLEVKAKDKVGNIGSAITQFGIDFSPPNTIRVSGPVDQGWADSSSVAFCWSGVDNLTQEGQFLFSYALDGSNYTQFASDSCHTFAGLSDTMHILRVKAKDKAGHEDESPLEISFTVDIFPPDTWITSGPSEGSMVVSSTVTFEWDGTDDKTPYEQLQYAYSIDGGNFSNYSSLKKVVLTALSDGEHIFAVKAHDLAGNDDPTLATRSFRVDTKGPSMTISEGPEEGVHIQDTTITFSWHGVDSYAPAESLLYRYQLDGTWLSSWSHDTTVTLTVGEGQHVFEVRGKNPSGNIGFAVRNFTVDLTPPISQLLGGPPGNGWINTTSVTFQWGGNDNLSELDSIRFSFHLDSDPWSDFLLTTSQTYYGLIDTNHVFQIKARDRAGNIEDPPLTINFGLDFENPNTWITSGPEPSSIIDTSAVTICWSGSDDKTPYNQIQYSFKLDNANFSSFNPDTCHTFINLSDGQHLVVVKSRDLAGNEDVSPDSLMFMVDAMGPTIAIALGPGENEHIITGDIEFHWNGVDAISPSESLLYSYQLDAAGFSQWSRDTVAAYSGLTEGVHKFDVRAKDERNHITKLSRSFGVDFTEPNTDIIAGPTEGDCWPNSSVTFEWSGTDNLSSPQELMFSYKIDNDPYSAWTYAKNHTFTGLSKGLHTFMVKSKDKAGYEDTSPAVVHFTVGYVDLVPIEISAPDSGHCNREITISWRVRNDGDCSASSIWFDKIYLSDDSTVGSDVFLAEYERPNALNPGGEYFVTHSVLLPDNIEGDYWIVLIADGSNSVFEEGYENNNSIVSSPIAITIPPHPDLRVTGLTIPNEGWSGQGVYIEWTVKNFGSAATVGKWKEYVYLSDDSTIGNDTKLSEFTYDYGLDVDSSYTHIHPITFPEDIEGDYWIIVRADGGNSINEYEGEGNNYIVSKNSLHINLSPFPDLIVTQVSVPLSVQNESQIPINWTVMNGGTGATNAPLWYDRIYLSLDTLMDAGDRAIQSFQNFSYLGAGEVYTNEKNITLPQDVIGNYYVLVKTDDQNHINEHGYDGNNVYHSNLIFIELSSALPWLEGEFIVCPQNIYANESFYVSWRVWNAGTAAMTETDWDDCFAISSDDQWRESGWIGVCYNHHLKQPLAPGDTAFAEMSISIPSNAAGDTIFLFIDPDAHLRGNSGGIPFYKKVYVYPILKPDLEPTNVAVTIDTATSGCSLPVQWSVRNNGPGSTGSGYWIDSFYLSKDDSLSGNTDILIGSRAHSTPVHPGSSYTVTTELQVPDNLVGAYYLFVYTDGNNQVSELDWEDNNETHTVFPIEIVPPPPVDLVVTNVGYTGQAWSGKKLDVTWTVKNLGPTSTIASSWLDNAYLSKNDTLEVVKDSLLVSLQHIGVLDSGSEYIANGQVSMPHGISGNYHIIVHVDWDSVVNDLAYNNNVYSAPITVNLSPPPDLVVTNISVSGGPQAGKPVNVQWRVANTGVGATDNLSWKDNVYLSVDDSLNKDIDLLLGSFIHSGDLQMGTNYVSSRDIIMPPDAVGTYYLFIQTDAEDDVYEYSAEDNNVHSIPINIEEPAPELPDLSAVELSSPSTARSGDYLQVSTIITNAGDYPTSTGSSKWWDSFYLSSDSVLDISNDQQLASFYHGTILEKDSSYSISKNILIPNGVSGRYYLFVLTDSKQEIEESLEANNTSYKVIDISLLPPDLQVSYVHVPDTTLSGQPLQVKWKVSNEGIGSTVNNRWIDIIYLSKDQILDETDFKLGYREHKGMLGVLESYKDSAQVVIPLGYTGRYFIVIDTDRNNSVYEYDREDNNYGINPAGFIIEMPPPVDLIITDVKVPDTLFVGDPIEIEWSTENHSQVALAAELTDAIYLSSDSLLDPGDIIITTVKQQLILPPQMQAHHRSFLPYEYYSNIISDILPGAVPSDYYVIVKTDIKNNVYETNENNNATASSGMIRVQMREITMGITIHDTIAAYGKQYLRFKPQPGEDIAITFSGGFGDGDLVCYISGGSIPNEMHYDYVLGDINGGLRDIVISGVTDRWYYITLMSNLPSELEYSISVNPLNFGIRSIDPDSVSNDGLARIRVIGAKISTNDTLFISSSADTLETIINSLYINSSELAALADLEGFHPGTYDMILASNSYGRDTLVSALKVFSSKRPSLSAKIIAPPALRRQSDFSIILQYANVGVVDLIAPELVVSSSDNAVIGLSNNKAEASSSLRILAVGSREPYGILSPGDGRQVNIYVFPVAGGEYEFNLTILDTEVDTLIDWQAMGESLRQFYKGDDESWNAIYGQFVTSVGPSMGTLLAILAADASLSAMEPEDVQNFDEMLLCELGLNSLIDTNSISISGKDFEPLYENGPIGPITGSPKEKYLNRMLSSGGDDTYDADNDVTYYDVDGNKVDMNNLPYSNHYNIIIHGNDQSSDDPMIRGFSHSINDLSEGYTIIVDWRGGAAGKSPWRTIRSGKLTKKVGEKLAADLGSAGIDARDISVFAFSFGTWVASWTGSALGHPFHEAIFFDVPNWSFDFTNIGNLADNVVVYQCGSLFDRDPEKLSDFNIDKIYFVDYYGWDAHGYPINKIVNTNMSEELRRKFWHGIIGDCEEALVTADLSTLICVDDYFDYFFAQGYSWSIGTYVDLGVFSTRIVISHDPNEKRGPTSPDSDPRVQVNNYLPYTIYFENEPKATAPAQNITIMDTLDNDLDWRSFALNEISFADTTILVPENSHYYQDIVQLENGYLLQLDAGINIVTGEAHWNFSTIDPNTGLPPLDPFAGFLPPNDSTGVGEGHISFAIKPKQDLLDGTEITNKATIIFDTNDPIMTNEVVNVTQRVLPDLLATSAGAQSSHTDIIEGMEVIINSTVTNQNESEAGTFRVYFFQGNPDSSGIQIDGYKTIFGLNASESQQVKTSWIPYRLLGEQDIFMKIDAENVVEESDETNNMRTLTLNIQPRTYTVDLSQGINLVSLPLEPEQPFTARSFANFLGASMVIEYDTTGIFVPFIPASQSGDGFEIEGSKGYIAVLEDPKTVTFSGMTHIDTVAISKGLNFVSLPLKPDSSYTARKYCEKLGANMLIRYDKITEKFEAFIPDFHTGDGFDIQGARSYLAFSDKDTVVQFSGEGWMGSESAPSGVTAFNHEAEQRKQTSILGIAGVIYQKEWERSTPIEGRYSVNILNKRNGAETKAKIDSQNGEFAAAFVDFENNQPIVAGDELEMRILNSDGKLVSNKIYAVTTKDIERKYALFDVVIEAAVLRVSRLYQNFPNPFNPITKIRYQIAKSGPVTLRIYNVKGQLVKTLVSKPLLPGYYEAYWKGDNDRGNKVASGVYFYRLRAPGYIKSRKMVLIK
jgi:subtilase family serine protease